MESVKLISFVDNLDERIYEQTHIRTKEITV